MAVDSAKNVRRFMNRVKVEYPLLVIGAAGTQLAEQFGNRSAALPFTVVMSRSGKIVTQTLGRIDSNELRRVIENELAP